MFLNYKVRFALYQRLIYSTISFYFPGHKLIRALVHKPSHRETHTAHRKIQPLKKIIPIPHILIRYLLTQKTSDPQSTLPSRINDTLEKVYTSTTILRTRSPLSHAISTEGTAAVDRKITVPR